MTAPFRSGGRITIRRNGASLVVEGNVTVQPAAVENTSTMTASGHHRFTSTPVTQVVSFDANNLKAHEVIAFADYADGDAIEYLDNAGDGGVLVGAVLNGRPSKNQMDGVVSLEFHGTLEPLTGDAA